MKKVFLFFLLIAFIVGTAVSFYLYQLLVKPNTINKEPRSIYIKTGSDYNDMVNLLSEQHILNDVNTFNLLADQMNLKNNIYAGKYLIKPGMNNKDLIRYLRSGSQVPVNVVFNKERTLADLAQTLDQQIEMDSLQFMNYILDSAVLKKLQLNENNVISLFIPNTYEMYWNTDAKKFTSKMQNEYKKFWNKNRKQKLEEINLSDKEVQTIASIVAEETNQLSEMERIAGVYLNRLKKGWRLEADPTVKFAIGDFAIKRILNQHLNYDSPFNTYKYKGIPPGPICTANQKEIDAVLNAENHNYMYFCAKEDFSGYHNFAKTLKEHNRNARLYHKALNNQKIFQ